MGAYRHSRYPERHGFAVVILILFFIVYYLKSSETTFTPESLSEVKPKGPRIASKIPWIAPKNPRIAIVTFVTHEVSYTHLSLRNKQFYAQRHGYDFFVDYDADTPRGIMWHKFIMIEEAMATQKYDWIWWVDFDTLITNTNIKLEDIIAESLADNPRADDIDFLFTGDCDQLNAGSFIVRSRPSADDFLNRVRIYHDDHKDLCEQDCIRDVVNENKHGEVDTTLWIPQWKINAFPEEIPCYDKSERRWERGMFTVHFAGAWAHLPEVEDPYGYLMRKYEQDIIWS